MTGTKNNLIKNPLSTFTSFKKIVLTNKTNQIVEYSIIGCQFVIKNFSFLNTIGNKMVKGINKIFGTARATPSKDKKKQKQPNNMEYQNLGLFKLLVILFISFYFTTCFTNVVAHLGINKSTIFLVRPYIG